MHWGLCCKVFHAQVTRRYLMNKPLILLLILVAIGSGPVGAQTIADASMTLIDHDGNGFANIGDEVEVSVVVNGAVTGTSVRVFNNNLFESAGPFNLFKVTPGFGDGIEYARTLPIGPGSHDGVAAGSVNFLVQVRLNGVTMGDVTDLTMDGVTELIDNSPPAASNAVFTGPAGTLIPGTEFEVGIDASDGGGSVQVTADLSRLGLGDSVPIPLLAGDSWLLDGEQIQEATISEQVSLAQDRSIVFTVTDDAGNLTVYDSAADSQIRTVDNVSPPAPQLLAFQRATNFDNATDLFDLVVTDGPDPVDQFGEPLLNQSGQPITYSDLMSGGNIDIDFSASGQPFNALTTVGYNSNGTLVQLNLPFSEYAESKMLEFRAQPAKFSGLSGEVDLDSVVIQRGVVEAILLAPEEGQVIGNGPGAQLSSVIAQPVGPLADYAIQSNFRAYFRDVGNPNTQDFLSLIPGPDGTFVEDLVVDADDFWTAGFGTDVDMVARPTFRVNGVTLRNLTPNVAYQNNPIVRIEIDPDLRADPVFEDRFEEQP